MDERPVKIWSSVAMLLGLLPVLIFREDPMEILRIAQALPIVAFPLLSFLVLRISSDEEMMGRYANGPVLTVIGVIGYLAVIGFVLNYMYEVIGFVM